MQNNKYFTNLIFLFCFSLGINAQIEDVFTGKSYSSFYFLINDVFNDEFDSTSIQKDKFSKETSFKRNIEEQLKIDVRKKIQDEYEFFQLQKKASIKQSRYEEIQEFIGYSVSSAHSKPDLNSIEIRLIDVVNNWGVYRIIYSFNHVNITEYKMGNYTTNTINNLSKKLEPDQKEILKETSISKLLSIYLLQTKKIELSNVNRILAILSGEEQTQSFSENLDFSEVLIYPYFSGVMIEFPAFSSSSKHHYYKAFRVLLTGKEKDKILPFFKNLKEVFSSNFDIPNKSVIKDLNNDNLFVFNKLYLLKSDNLDVLNTHLSSLTHKTPSSVCIKTFWKGDEPDADSLTHSSTSVFTYSKNGHLERQQDKNSKQNILKDKKFYYDVNNRKEAIYEISNHKEKLKLFNYTHEQVSAIEEIELNDFRTAHGQPMREIKIFQEHFVYHNNSKLSRKFNLIGNLNNNFFTTYRKIDQEGYHTKELSILTNADKEILGVRFRNTPPQAIRFNQNNQPVEIHDDKKVYIYTYDHQKRLTEFSSYKDRKITYYFSIKYREDLDNPLQISKKIKDNQLLINEFEVEYRGD